MALQLQSATSQTIQTHGDSASAVSAAALKSQPWNHQIFRKLNAGSTSNGAPVSPSIVVIVIVLSILLILSAFLHLVIRWLARHPRRDPNRSIASLTALEGQLQQLFHIHDSGLEQAFIDALPIFLYNTITGLKEGADCAICLCEFEGDDRLRLLPSCSHAFHMECIDTWLLSHSTCPLCRQALHPECWELPPYSGQGLLLGSSRSSVLGENERRINVPQSEASQVQERNVCSELAATRLQNDHLQMGISAMESQLHNERYIEPALEEDNTKSASAYRGIDMQEFEQSSMHESGRKVSVQLGRCRVIDQHGSRGINSSRRSYSKGPYEYVMESSKLEVVIVATTTDGTSSRWLNRCHGHRATQSLADLETARRNIADIQASPASENMGSCWASASFRRLRSVDMKENEGKSCVGSVLQCQWEANDLISTIIDVDTGVRENTLSIRETDQKQASDLINDSQAIDFMNHQTINLPTEPSKRAVSFRMPSRLKAHSNRRALSETEVIIDNWVSDQLIAQQSLDPGPSSAISSSSLAQKTFHWLMGRPQNRTSVPPINPHHIVDFPLI